MELSRSTWLITSLSPGGGEKMSKHGMPSGDDGALLARFAELRRKAFTRTGESLPIIVIQEAGLDGFWIHRVLQQEGIEGHVVDPASIATSRRRRRAKTDRIAARRCFARCWPTSAANRGCVRWSKRRLPRKRTAAGFAGSARP
jgi:transposase